MDLRRTIDWLSGVARDPGGWARDLAAYRVLLPRLLPPWVPGAEGVDYADPAWRDSVRRAVDAIHPRRMRLRLAGTEYLTPTARALRFERLDGPLPPFREGQYVNLFVERDGVRTSRPFSISSPSGADRLELTVRAKPGGFVSTWLFEQVEEGATFESTGPEGHFYHEPLIDGADLVFLAGGSGITPVMSMLRGAARRGWPFRAHLLYGTRDADDVIFGDELKALARSTDRFRYSLVVSEPPARWRGLKGYLDADLVRREAGEPEGRTFFVVGPRAMYDFCLVELERLGVPRRRIRRESYGPPDDVTRSPGWPADVAADATFRVEVQGLPPFRARAGEPLMASLERNGVVVPAVCRSGECSACRTRLVSGRVFLPPFHGLRDWDREHGWIHPCMTYPVDDLVLAL